MSQKNSFKNLFKRNIFKKPMKDESPHESVRTEVPEPEELQTDDDEYATAADSQVNIAPAEQSETCLEDPAETFQELKQSEAFLRETVTGLESQLKQHEAENENLLSQIRTLEENKKILTQKNKSLTDELADLQSLTQQKHKEIAHLEEKMNDLEWLVDEAVRDKENQMKFLSTKMEEEIKTVQMELHNLQEKQDFLIDQNSCVVAELTEMKKQRDELKEENLELRKTVRELKDQLSLLQEEKKLADSEMRNPAAEPPPNSGSWFPGAKYLLTAGLGVALGGLLIFSAF